jgi:hypothetical protein
MREAKIKLSEDELLLVHNAGVILTKNAIIQKIISFFSLIAEEMKTEIEKKQLPAAITTSTPKISKGENYKGLPYVILDYPRVFTRENIFAVRTMFWWGSYFSVTLHLKGDYQEMFSGSIKRNISYLTENKFSICVSSDQWQHELSEDNYISLSCITENQLDAIIKEKQFLKLSAKAAFDRPDDTAIILMGLYKDIFQSLQAH